jgi:hypothetical protein
MISGGYSSRTKRVFRHDPVALTTEELPNMIEGSPYATGCALFYSAKHEYRPVAVVVSGTAELLDFTQTDQWEKRKTLNLIYTYLYTLSLRE